MNYRIFTLFLLFIPVVSFSQKPKFGIETGLGFYYMRDLKEMTEAVHYQTPIVSKIESNFPPGLYYQPSFSIEINNSTFGVLYSFNSTRSRVSANDGSSKYSFDMGVKSNNIGLFLDSFMPSETRLKFCVDLSSGLLFTKLKTEEFFQNANSSLIHDKNSFKVQNFYLQLGYKTIYTFDSFNLELNTGYLIQATRAKFRSGNTPRLNGFRLGVNVVYYLKNHEYNHIINT